MIGRAKSLISACRRPLVIVLLYVAFAASAHADTKITNRMTVAGQSIDSILYIKGQKARSEMHFPDGTMVRVDECGRGRTLHINDHNHTYFYEERVDSLLPAPESQGRPTVTVLSRTNATGEHRQILGREARHLRTEIRTQSASAACGGDTEMTADGWYVDLDVVPSCLSQDIESILRERMRALGCQAKIRFQTSGIPLTGYPLVLDMTVRQMAAGSKSSPQHSASASIHQETLDISTIPASDDLFQPPDGYREVHSMEELLSANPSASPEEDQDQDEDQLAEQREHAVAKAKMPGVIRIGVAFPQFESSDKRMLPDAIHQQIVAAIKAQGFDAVALDSELQEDAVKECQPQQCDYILLSEVTVGRAKSGSSQAHAKAGANYEARVVFTVAPVKNPARHLDLENFFDSPSAKASITEAMQQAAKAVKEQIANLK